MTYTVVWNGSVAGTNRGQLLVPSHPTRTDRPDPLPMRRMSTNRPRPKRWLLERYMGAWHTTYELRELTGMHQKAVELLVYRMIADGAVEKRRREKRMAFTPRMEYRLRPEVADVA
jgi:hypothetical protein